MIEKDTVIMSLKDYNNLKDSNKKLKADLSIARKAIIESNESVREVTKLSKVIELTKGNNPVHVYSFVNAVEGSVIVLEKASDQFILNSVNKENERLNNLLGNSSKREEGLITKVEKYRKQVIDLDVDYDIISKNQINKLPKRIRKKLRVYKDNRTF